MKRTQCYMAPVFDPVALMPGTHVKFVVRNRLGAIKRQGYGIVSTNMGTYIMVEYSTLTDEERRGRVIVRDDMYYLSICIRAKEVLSGKNNLEIVEVKPNA